MIINHIRLIPELSDGICTGDGYVRIEGDRITEVSAQYYTGDEETFDGAGKTLIPGLIDLHTHIGMGQANRGGFFPEGADMYILTCFAEQVQHYLDWGFTTIRDCGSPRHASNYVRDMIRRGIIPGPDVLACGPAITSSALDDGSDAYEGNAFADGEIETRKATHKELAQGADFIKIYASGSAGDPKGHPLYPIMSVEEIQAAVDVARIHHSYVAAHCHADAAIRACAEAGVHTLEHVTYMSDETIARIKELPDCCLVPTLAACFVSQEDPEERAFWLARLTPMLEWEGAVVKKAYEAGLKIGYGTDSGSGSKQYRQGIEFVYRKQYCGMSDMDLLLQATRYAAEIAYIDREVGSVKMGLKANLVLADGRPDEDISVLYKKPLQVWKAGVKVR